MVEAQRTGLEDRDGRSMLRSISRRVGILLALPAIVNSNTARPRLYGWALALALCSTWVVGCRENRPHPALPSRALLASDITLTPDTTVINGLVPRNTTLASMLSTHGLPGDVVQRVVTAAQAVFDPRRLKSAQPFSLERTFEGALRFFEYEIDADWFLRVMPVAAGVDDIRAELVPIPKTLEHATTAGTIGGDTPSLFAAMEGAGEGPDLTLALANIFSGDIDFNTDLQPDDRFALSFEKWNREGRRSTYGVITAAEFRNEGRVLRAIRFTPPGGKPGYYDEQGRSLRRFFLKSPLKFEPRITSRYSLRRMHPVLGRARAHRGVDYGAPTGAPVVAVSPGTVVSAGYDHANGRMVRLRHAGGYQSYYLHLSAFAPGIRAGAQVGQGQTIGLVGATGLATGPHLHYGLQRNGQWLDPVREHRNMPPGEPIPASALAAFEAERDRALAELARTSS
jgi:murein DD-endopeptidase MepM/ murein hydrolase activator NlpD